MADGIATEPAQLRRSPLAHLQDRLGSTSACGRSGAALRELSFLTMVVVRVRPGSPAFDRIGKQLGTELPEACGRVASAGAHSALWLGPDEWLVVSPDGSGALSGVLSEALADDPGSVVDVSANRTTLELSGPAARATLEKGCPVDLHPRSFGPGTAVATTVGPVPVLLWQTGETTYRLLPRSSFADYVARWLIDATTEFSHPAVS